ADIAEPRRPATRRPARGKTGTANHQRTRFEAVVVGLWRPGHARISRRDDRRGKKRRARARLPRGAQGGVGRRRPQDRARPRRRRPQERRGAAHAFAQLSERLDRFDPPPSDRAFLVQEFVADGIALFAGIAPDPDFGLWLAFGLGGTAIEVTRDFALRMLPLREGEVEAMIAETRGAALLASVRGRPAADVGGVIACLEALADFAQQNA